MEKQTTTRIFQRLYPHLEVYYDKKAENGKLTCAMDGKKCTPPYSIQTVIEFDEFDQVKNVRLQLKQLQGCDWCARSKKRKDLPR